MHLLIFSFYVHAYNSVNVIDNNQIYYENIFENYTVFFYENFSLITHKNVLPRDYSFYKLKCMNLCIFN